MKKTFKLKIADHISGASITITFDLEKPLGQQLREAGMIKCHNHLRFIATPANDYDLCTIHQLCKAVMEVYTDALIWDITVNMPEDDEPWDLNGYLTINKTEDNDK